MTYEGHKLKFFVTFLEFSKFEGNSEFLQFHGEEIQRVDQSHIVRLDKHDLATIQKEFLSRNIVLSRKETRQDELTVVAENICEPFSSETLSCCERPP